MSQYDNLEEVSEVLTETLQALSFRDVAWRGFYGDRYYSQVRRYSHSLASLASLASSDVALCHLAAGWKRARAVLPSGLSLIGNEQPLVIVINDLSSLLFHTLETLRQGRLEAIVVFLDPQRRYIGNFYDEKAKEICSYPGIFAAARHILYPPPVDVDHPKRLCNMMAILSQERGIKILHILGSALTQNSASSIPRLKSQSSERFSASFATEPAVKRSPKLKPGDLTFEQSALNRIAIDLQNVPLVSCLWTSPKDPKQFRRLHNRLQFSPVDGVVLQAVGMAASGIHPLIVLTAADMPKVLSELFAMAPFPITILLTDAGLTSQGDLLPNANFHDLAILRSFEHMQVGVPSDEEEARSMLLNLLASSTPGLLRLSSTPAVGLPSAKHARAKTKLQGRCLHEGQDLAFICLGSMAYHALLASRTLESWGYKTAVYDMGWLNPLDTAILEKAAKTGRIITVEEHSTVGGLGSAVAEYILQHVENQCVQLRSAGLKSELYSTSLEDHGLSMEGLLEYAKDILQIEHTPSSANG
ncbi:MAG: hypothetical protein K6A35_02590 [bacterium]|nr:hypothetical protein [bacterium]